MDLKNLNVVKNIMTDENELLERIGSGNAVLFVGSGFSTGVESVSGKPAPLTKDLANLIGDLGNFPGDGDLKYASERYIRRFDAKDLVKFLVERFHLKEGAQDHSQITTAPWRRVYTTNYDLLIEKSAEREGKIIKSLDLDSPVSQYLRERDICLHINGSIRNLTIESLNNSFKLSNSSYLSPESFATSTWYSPFKKDLQLASAIVFVGYSLYDIEIQKLLHESPEYKEKTYFVVREGETERNIFSLEIYGLVMQIGVAGFASLLRNSLRRFLKESSPENPSALARYRLEENPRIPRDSDVDNMLLYGNVPDSIFDSVVTSDSGAPILVTRELAVTETRRSLANGKNIAVISDFGNGKSIFLRQMAAQLTAEGRIVYTVVQDDPENFSDLEILARSNLEATIIVDDYENYLEFVEAFAAHSCAKLRIIISTRTRTHERWRERLKAANFPLHEITIDELDATEARSMVSVLNNAGLWGANASLPFERKQNLILEDYKKQFSLTLLSAIKSPQIVRRVQDILKSLLSNKQYRDTVFAIALLQTLNSNLNLLLVSETADNDAIYDLELRANEDFRQLFRIEGNLIRTKSSLFASSLVINNFNSRFIVDFLRKIVKRFGVRSALPEHNRICKDLLRFSIVERLLPADQKGRYMLEYFEELKRAANWLVNDPHFWLQYSMTHMQFKNYKKAQDFLDQAYALAKNRQNYHTTQFDTQQARLWIDQSANSENVAEAFSKFKEAHALLRRVQNDVHKFRKFERYKEVFDRQFLKFSGAQKADFEQACKNAVDEIRMSIASGAMSIIDIGRAESIMNVLLKVVERIKELRKN